MKQNRIGDYRFDYDKILDIKGDTLLYQLYSLVRLKGLFRKTSINIDEIKNHIYAYSLSDSNDIKFTVERQLAIHLTQFNEIIKAVKKQLAINILCEYMYDLANKINKFWKECKIINTEYELNRLKLCFSAKIVLEFCLKDILKVPTNQVNFL